MTEERKEAQSSFFPILQFLFENVPGAHAAIFCDEEGESIEYCGKMPPLEIKTAGAYASIILRNLKNELKQQVEAIVISCNKLSMVIYDIKGYNLTLLLNRRTWTATLELSMKKAIEKFEREAF